MATVFAVPDVLERFRVGAGDGAEELARRAVSLDVAVGAYLRATERAYAAPCEAAPAAVRAFADALGGLGGWVGRIGAAFLGAVLFRGRRVATLEGLLAGLPPGLRLDAPLPVAGALVAAEVIASGAHPRDLRAVAELFGTATPTGAALALAADGPAGRSIGRYLDWGAAAARGAAQAEARWRSEPDRPLPSRLARAGVDGALNTAGAYAGSAAVAAAGLAACGPGGPAASAACAAAGARAGGIVGGELAEVVSDLVLGPEPVVVPRLAEAQASAALVDATTDRARAEADRRAEFVLERPWLWDDEYADAPQVAHPAPVDAPTTRHGPR